MALSIAPLFSGSKGNCIYVGTENAGVLVDAGFSCVRIQTELKKAGLSMEQIRGIVVTHEHNDHIAGLGATSRKYNIPVYANAQTWEQIHAKAGEIDRSNMRVIEEEDFFIQDLCVQPFKISHDAARPFGYSISAGNKKVSIMTDLGKVTEHIYGVAEGSSIVLLESNHDVGMLQMGKYPYALKQRILSTKGHLSNEDAAVAAFRLATLGVKGILLGHISENNNFEKLAYQTVSGYLEQNGVKVGRHIALAVASQRCDGGAKVYTIE